MKAPFTISFRVIRPASERAAWIARAGGALLILGSVLPWAWLPLAGARIPLPGVFGFGALTLVAGVWLARGAPAWAAGAAGALALYLAGNAWSGLPRAVNLTMIGFEMRLQPMNDLMARFGIAPMNVFDTATPWDRLRGPGVLVMTLGGLLAITGAAMQAAQRRLDHEDRRCAGCGCLHPVARAVAFCVTCGRPVVRPSVCRACRTPVEPDDRFCSACGEPLGARE